ncbi:MAG: Gfo/Idh/MocA family oxidoreductase [Firmicutes bacterium]|nr:Gfo/Idh/MocA family oxidoreductase [Bacillota bacterium]
MEKIKLGIMGTSDIAFRRFLPALLKQSEFKYTGVASRVYSNTEKFTKPYGGKGYNSYNELIEDSEVDAIYVPLPPALHYEWAMKALKRGKHVLLEKPFTIELQHTKEILDLARAKELTVHENYMFIYHSQLERIKEIVNDGLLGHVRLYRIAFGFPKREANDFRYDKKLGGGALLDCGGYPLRLAVNLLGCTTTVTASKLNYSPEFDVDLYGSATLENNEGQVAQVSFGMDNSYKCELEIWGSEGSLLATRIFTAGDEFEPTLILKIGNEEKTIQLAADDQFLGSINRFYCGINHSEVRRELYDEILCQARLIEKIRGSE